MKVSKSPQKQRSPRQNDGSEQVINLKSVSNAINNLKNEKPMNIDLEMFSKFSELLDKQFRQSIDSIEQNFRENVFKIKELFSEKIDQFQTFNEAIQKNHEMISLQYENTQKKMKQKLDLIQADKKAWEDEKRLILAKNNFNTEILQLNVGGTHQLMVSQKVLTCVPNSGLQKMFSGMHELKRVDSSIFLDRDGSTFQKLVNYLRNDRKIYPEFENPNDQRLFTEELNYWGIKDDRLEEKKIEQKFQQEIVNMFKIEPGDELDFHQKNEVQDVVRQTWNMLGPMRLIDIVKNSLEPIDYSLPFGKSIDQYKTQIYGQFNQQTGKCQGICRQIFAEPNSHIYEGQCKNGQKRNGYGRQIYCDGNYYIGFWKDDKKNGKGKKVYVKTGKIEEGIWENGELKQ